MALSDAYVTAAAYYARKKTLAYDVDEGDDLLDDQLLAISRYIDRATGHFLGFNKDMSAVTRTYLPSFGGQCLDIRADYYVSVASITVDGTAVASTLWELTPRNAANMPEQQPYRAIEGIGYSWVPGTRVVVTGIAGWPAVPGAIVEAVVELTAMLRIETARATSAINEVNQLIQVSPQARDLIGALVERYKNWAAVIA